MNWYNRQKLVEKDAGFFDSLMGKKKPAVAPKATPSEKDDGNDWSQDEGNLKKQLSQIEVMMNQLRREVRTNPSAMVQLRVVENNHASTLQRLEQIRNRLYSV